MHMRMKRYMHIVMLLPHTCVATRFLQDPASAQYQSPLEPELART